LLAAAAVRALSAGRGVRKVRRAAAPAIRHDPEVCDGHAAEALADAVEAKPRTATPCCSSTASTAKAPRRSTLPPPKPSPPRGPAQPAGRHYGPQSTAQADGEMPAVPRSKPGAPGDLAHHRFG